MAIREKGIFSSKIENQFTPEYNKWDMWQEILDMFGTEKAKNDFIDLCKKYKNAYCSQKYEDLTGGEDYFHGQKNVLNEMKIKKIQRAGLHQEIQTILQKLSMHAKPNSKQEKILRFLSDRDNMHDLIDECIQL